MATGNSRAFRARDGTLIPIITAKNSAVKDNRTLLWASSQDSTADIRWNRWDGIVTSMADFEKWHNVINIVGVVLLAPTEGDIELIRKYADKVHMVYTTGPTSPAHAIYSMGIKVYFLEHIEKGYPFIQPVWDGSVEDAVACIAVSYHYNTIVDWCGGSAERAACLTAFNIKLLHNVTPPKLWFVTQYFVHKDTKRAREIRKCLMNNCVNTSIDTILMLTEEDFSHEWSGLRGAHKIQQRIIGKRLTYADLLQATIDHIPENTIVVYANSDIYLDSTIDEVFSIDMRDKMLALLRWDTDERGTEPTIGNRADSQDTWIVLSDSIKARKWNMDTFNYKLGIAGCDNKFTFDMFSNRFVISNPCRTIKTLHVHQSMVRNYDPRDAVMSKFYMHIQPSSLTTIVQKTAPDTKIGAVTDPDFPINIQCTSATNGTTWCTMVGRNRSKYVWTFGTESIQKGQQIPYYKFKDSFAKANGIVYDYNAVYLGNNISEAMNGSDMSLMIDYNSHVSVVDKFIAVPVVKSHTFENHDSFCLKYLTYVFQLVKEHPDAYVWVPESMTHLFNIFDNNAVRVRGMKWSPDSVVYAKEIIGILPDTYECGRNGIQSLRSCLKGWKDVGNEKTCAILIDQDANTAKSPITARFAEGISKILGDEWTVETIPVEAGIIDAREKLVGKKLCIFFGGPERQDVWSKLWTLPTGCRVIEFQNELKTDGEFQHMAGACAFDSWISTLYKGSQDDMREQALTNFTAWKKRVASSEGGEGGGGGGGGGERRGAC